MPDVGPAELIIIILIVALLFGSKKIPEIARSMGKASSEFKKGIREGQESLAEPTQAPDTPNGSEPTEPAELPGAEA
jgi:sec-independent protein translocase protein TatA